MSIQTTLVGSHPTPEWLCPQPTERALQNARWVVIPIQEQARIDLLTDYELSRIDVNHPETNGMIEYFVRPLSGIRSAITRDDVRPSASRRSGIVASNRTRYSAPTTSSSLPLTWWGVNRMRPGLPAPRPYCRHRAWGRRQVRVRR
jgi:methionine synthase II (cobalamin-independent)